MSEAQRRNTDQANSHFARQEEKEREDRARTRRRHERVVKKLAAHASNLPIPEVRRDTDLDLKIFKGVKEAVERGDDVRFTARQGDGVTDYRSRERRLRSVNEESGRYESTFRVPHWDHTGDRLKLLAWMMTMHDRMVAAFTLQLSEKEIEKARSNARGFAAHFRDRITRSLKTMLPRHPRIDFFFVVEGNVLIEPHIHGVIVVPENVRLRQSLRRALITAAGDWGKRNQLDLRPITNAIGWVRYIAKWRHTTEHLLQDRRVTAASAGVRAEARSWFGRVRASSERIP